LNRSREIASESCPLPLLLCFVFSLFRAFVIPDFL
jgi:hypothetical protein